jgi:hypothetical protein
MASFYTSLTRITIRIIKMEQQSQLGMVETLLKTLTNGI